MRTLSSFVTRTGSLLFVCAFGVALNAEAAPAWLAERRLPARLVCEDGAVTCVAGWPEAA